MATSSRSLRHLLGLFAFCLTASSSYSQDFSFVRHDYLFPQTTANGILGTGDFDGDGVNDILALSGPKIILLRGKGDGTFQAPLPATGNITVLNTAIADFNRDGKLDVTGTNGLLLGTSDGRFREAPSDPTVADILKPRLGNRNLTADFNEDGIPDLAGSDGSSVQIVLGNGDGTFRKSSSISGIDLSRGRFVTDINRDGHSDIVFNDPSGFRAFTGNGRGAFQEAPTVRVFANSTVVAIADFNGDQAADWVVRDPTSRLTVMLANGDGSFSNFLDTGFLSSSVIAGDFNGDGRQDLALTSNPLIRIALGVGDGTFAAPKPLDANASGNFPVAGDWNRDGRLDLAGIADDALAIHLNTIIAPGERPLLTAVSSAASKGFVSPGSLATLYGEGFSMRTEQSPLLKEQLGGIRLRVRDSSGQTHPAEMLYVSPTQINLRIPEPSASGSVTIELTHGDETPFAPVGLANVIESAPTLFGCGYVNSILVVAEPSDGSTVPQIAPCTPGGQFVFPALVNFYGTGFRGATPANTRVLVHGIEKEPLYVGPEGSVPGLDKITLRVEPNDLLWSDDGSYASWVTILVNGLRTNSGYTPIY